MVTLADRLKSPTLRRAVMQRRLVLDGTTAREDELNRREMSMTAFAKALGKSKALVSRIFRRQPNLTFFTAVELADVLDMDVEVAVVRRPSRSNVIYIQEVLPNSGMTKPASAPVTAMQLPAASNGR